MTLHLSLSLSLDFLGCAKLSLKQLRDEGGNNGPWTKRLLLEDVVNSKLTWFISYYLIVIIVIWLLISVLYNCAVLFSFFFLLSLSRFLTLDFCSIDLILSILLS